MVAKKSFNLSVLMTNRIVIFGHCALLALALLAYQISGSSNGLLIDYTSESVSDALDDDPVRILLTKRTLMVETEARNLSKKTKTKTKKEKKKKKKKEKKKKAKTTTAPTKNPTKQPTKNPTKQPTKNPTKQPTKNPTKQPSGGGGGFIEPTGSPTKKPTVPTPSPTESLAQPTTAPSGFISISEESEVKEGGTSMLLMVGGLALTSIFGVAGVLVAIKRRQSNRSLKYNVTGGDFPQGTQVSNPLYEIEHTEYGIPVWPRLKVDQLNWQNTVFPRGRG